MLELNNTNISIDRIDMYNRMIIDNKKVCNTYGEAIGTSILDINNYEGDFYIDNDNQLRKGDIYIENDNQLISIDFKSCYVNNYNHRIFNHNTLAIDIEYYTHDLKDIYIQENTKDNLGWLYHLTECDILMCVNEKDRRIFVIENFQKLREFLIDLDMNYNILEDRELLEKYKEVFATKISNDRRKKDNSILKKTKTVYLNLDNVSFLHSIGVNVYRYDYKIVR